MNRNNFTHILFNCDYRVRFTDDEMQILKRIENELTEIENAIKRNSVNTRTLINQDKTLVQFVKETTNEYYQEQHKRDEIASNIQMNAEERFIKNVLNGDSELILFDVKEKAKNYFSLNIKDIIPYEHNTDLYDSKNYQALFKRYVFYISYNSSRMHRNYCFKYKLSKCIQSINEHLMTEARKKFKEEYNITPNCDFSIFRYNKSLAELRKPNIRLLDPMKRNDSIVNYELNNYSIEFNEGIKYLDWQTLKFIDYLSMLYYDSEIFDGRFFRIPLNHYMTTFNLKAERNAKSQVIHSIDQLRKTKVKILNNNKKEHTKLDSCLIGGIGGYSNNLITIEINTVLNHWFRSGKPFTAPNQLFRINILTNPHSYPILKRITEHKNMNFEASNENIIRIRTLLESCRDLPKHSEIEKSGQIDQRIKRPLFRDLDYLNETLTYEIINQDDNIISMEMARNLPFEQFENLRIRVIWKSFPERKKAVKELS